MVVVEERDARGSSLRRSRRTGTLVHAIPCAGAGSPVALELVGDAGTETYMFRMGSCSLFRSFVHQGKLTVCTAGMRHQVLCFQDVADLFLSVCLSLSSSGRRVVLGGSGMPCVVCCRIFYGAVSLPPSCRVLVLSAMKG